MANINRELEDIAKKARYASQQMLNLSSALKDRVLKSMADALLNKAGLIISENKKDIAACRRRNFSQAFIDRLTLSEARIKQMADSLREIAHLSDPTSEVIKAWRRPNGLWIHKVRVPIGVIAIIYESRPSVTSDCIGLCFKTGNSVILRGGSEALNSNLSIFRVLNEVMKDNAVPPNAINMIHTKQKTAVDILLKLDRYIDLVIPRGGEGLINKIMRVSRIPVIKHYKGICHTYVDQWADLNMAAKICFNAKVNRPGVCNAMEAMLVHKNIAARFLPVIAERFKKAGVELRGCPLTRKIVKHAKAATEKDYHTEYLDLILSVKVMDNLQEAIEHINHYGSHHSDAIVTSNYENALAFLRGIDSACLYVNASTRFTDGYQFGMGAEIGISTDKLHARGPMALEELMTYKYMVFGDGQVRE